MLHGVSQLCWAPCCRAPRRVTSTLGAGCGDAAMAPRPDTNKRNYDKLKFKHKVGVPVAVHPGRGGWVIKQNRRWHATVAATRTARSRCAPSMSSCNGHVEAVQLGGTQARLVCANATPGSSSQACATRVAVACEVRPRGRRGSTWVRAWTCWLLLEVVVRQLVVMKLLHESLTPSWNR